MRARRIVGACAALLLGGCAGDACAPSIGPLDLGGGDQCRAAGGTCGGELFGCAPGTHPARSYDCLLTACCVPGATCEDNGGTCAGACGTARSISGFCPTRGPCCELFADATREASPASDAPVEASLGGTCDGVPCASGCACAPSPDAGARGVCECIPADAGSDASIDAVVDAPVDASPDATDASLDAPSDGPAASEPCGVITCLGGCICADSKASACLCP